MECGEEEEEVEEEGGSRVEEGEGGWMGVGGGHIMDQRQGLARKTLVPRVGHWLVSLGRPVEAISLKAAGGLEPTPGTKALKSLLHFDGLRQKVHRDRRGWGDDREREGGGGGWGVKRGRGGQGGRGKREIKRGTDREIKGGGGENKEWWWGQE